MNTAIWIVQGLVTLAFGMAGVGKMTMPYEKLAEQMDWVEDFSLPQVRGIALIEALGAIGVLLPALTGILPWLTPLAATGLMLVMVGAMATHYRRHEYNVILINVVLFALAAFVAYGRFFAEPL